MSAKRLDGAALARRWTEEAAARVAVLAARGVHPTLAVVVVGDNAASQLYVRNKERMCAAAGVASRRLAFPADVPPASVLRALAQLNADPGVHGILVQLPLPAHFDAARIVEAIAPQKDVDGFRADNLGALFMDAAALAPCTPQAVLALLQAHDIPVEGRHAVVVGRSNIVGKPLSLMLLARGATVTTCHSRTSDLEAHTRRPTSSWPPSAVPVSFTARWSSRAPP